MLSTDRKGEQQLHALHRQEGSATIICSAQTGRVRATITCSAQTGRVSNNYMLCTDKKGEQQLHAQYRQEGRATITCSVQTGREDSDEKWKRLPHDI